MCYEVITTEQNSSHDSNELALAELAVPIGVNDGHEVLDVPIGDVSSGVSEHLLDFAGF